MKPTKEQINKALELAEKLAIENEISTDGFTEFWYNFSANEWENYGKHRIYLNLKYGRTYKGRNKWKRGVNYCIDLSTGEVTDTSRDYNNADERRIMNNIADEVAESLGLLEVA